VAVFSWFYLATLNKNMKKMKDLLSHKQFAINCRANANTQRADDWLVSQGLNSSNFASTPIKLLQALQQANALLANHAAVLDPFQRDILTNFQRRMTNARLYGRIKESAAFPIFNISKIINRQIFKQNRQLIRQ
jgi:hypothetical protein